MNDGNKTNLLIGISSSIASYKILEVISALKKKGGYNITVAMTKTASEFVTPLTFSTMTGNKTHTDLWDDNDFIPHISLSDNADIFLVAPATFNIIGKIANGIADDLVTSIASAVHTRKMIAPAMNVHMYSNPILKKNLRILEENGWEIIPPDEGLLACNYKGKGKLASPEEIIRHIEYKPKSDSNFRLPLSSDDSNHLSLKGKKILVTAGGTVEPIDPVRYITNRSSGKMGISIVKKALEAGAEVTLIHAGVSVSLPTESRNIKAMTANEMKDAVLKEYPNHDVLIMASAVSDYRVKNPSSSKIKKTTGGLTLELEENPDILKEVSLLDKGNRIVIGFAAETNDLEMNAKVKLEKKKLDFIIANDVSSKDSGFESNNNRITIFDKNGGKQDFPLMSKLEVAEKILNLL